MSYFPLRVSQKKKFPLESLNPPLEIERWREYMSYLYKYVYIISCIRSGSLRTCMCVRVRKSAHKHAYIHV